ncbi:CoxG family protein [Ramlibacter sp.]|uniref:CoxG family protein n=1 Tax=Ramlibacter sp. TaxID=1917967 RepID=UPI003D0E019A
MRIEGTKALPAARAAVWQALNDPVFLQQVIPGCREVRDLGDGQLDIALTSAVGPIRANFKAQVAMSEVVEGESYVLSGSGSAGAAGSASGSMRLQLSDIPAGTLLVYEAGTEIQGRLAQLGARMIDSTARRFSEEFFANVVRALDPQAARASTDAAAMPASSSSSPSTPSASSASSPSWPWPGALPGPAPTFALHRLPLKLFIACTVGAFIGTAAALLIVR